MTALLMIQVKYQYMILIPKFYESDDDNLSYTNNNESVSEIIDIIIEKNESNWPIHKQSFS